MRRLAFALLLSAAPAMGQAPFPIPAPSPAPTPPPQPRAMAVVVPPGPLAYAPGLLVTIDASDSVGDDVDWDYDLPPGTYQEDTGHRKVYFAPPGPGTYPVKVQALGIVDGKIRFSKVKLPIVVSGDPTPPDDNVKPRPRPNPTPTPAPAPDPSPIIPMAERLYATLIYDLRDPSVAAIKQAGLAATLEADNCRWEAFPESAIRVQPDGSLSSRTLVEEQNLGPSIAAAGGLPCVLVQRKSDGKVVAALKSPAPEAVVGRIKALRGGAR